MVASQGEHSTRLTGNVYKLLRASHLIIPPPPLLSLWHSDLTSTPPLLFLLFSHFYFPLSVSLSLSFQFVFFLALLHSSRLPAPFTPLSFNTFTFTFHSPSFIALSPVLLAKLTGCIAIRGVGSAMTEETNQPQQDPSASYASAHAQAQARRQQR